VEGEYPENTREVLVGKEIADTIGVKVGSSMELSYKPGHAGAGDASADWVPGASLSGSAEGFNEAVLNVKAVLDDEAKISSVEVDASSQTENIGSLVGSDKSFLDQFIGKSLPLSMGEDVDALSGATISSQAVVDALNSSVSEEKAVAAENTERFNVTGILSTGGEEESYVYMAIGDLQKLTGGSTVWLDAKRISNGSSAEEICAWAESLRLPKEEIGMFYIHVHEAVLAVKAENNSSSEALLQLLKAGDITISMHDYGNFEKVGPLGISIPRNDEDITTTPGDVILYQGNQVTVYYDENRWDFTKLGHIDIDQDELKSILGSGDVTVVLSVNP
jgi:uncharacterized protein with FMN-binding domain